MDLSRPLPRWAVPAFLAVITIIVFARVIFGGETFVLRDHISYVGPSRMYLHDALHHGRLPGWWGQIGLGAPYAANPSHDVFYPPVLILAYVLPGRIAADWIVILHMFWAALGGAAFARRLGADDLGAALGGSATLLSGYVISMPPLCNAPLSVSWLPWLAYGADRIACAPDLRERVRAGLVTAACWCGLVLVGDPASLMDATLLTTVVLLARAADRWSDEGSDLPTRVWHWIRARAESFGFMAAAGAFGVALAGMVALPSLALLGTSERGGGFSHEYAASWPLHPWRLLELIWPRPYGDPTEPLRDWSTIIIGHGIAGQSERWSESAHLGLVVLAFAIFAAIRGGRAAPGARVLLGGAVVLVLLSLGRHLMWFYRFYEMIPKTNYIRYPEKHISGAIVILGGLAGAGFTDVWRTTRGRRRLAIGITAAIGVMFVVLLGALIGRSHWIDYLSRHATEDYQRMQLGDAFNVSLVGGAITVLAGFGAAAFLWWRESAPRAAAPVVLAMTLLPCVVHGEALQCVGSRTHFAGTPAIASDADLQEDEPTSPLALARTYRVDGSVAHGWTNEEIVYQSHDSLVPDMGGPYGYSTVPGYDPANDKRVENIFSTASTRDQLPRLMQALDVAWIIYPSDKAAELKAVVRGTSPDNMESMVRVDDRRPRAFLARRWERGTESEATEYILGDSWDPGLIFLDGPGDVSSAPGDLVPCDLSGPAPEDVVETCDSDTGGYAVLLDGMKDGWTVTVDGQPARIERADAVARAVRLGPGKHAVHYHFRTPGLRKGFLVAAGAWLIFALLIFLTREP
jgi:hypothetical protein